MASVLIEVLARQKTSRDNRTLLEIPVVIMENVYMYPCSFKCVKSVAVMACVWLPPFLFFIFYLSVVCYKQLV